MMEEKKKSVRIKWENVAVPEVKVADYEEEILEQGAELEKTSIDYSGAVPEVRVKNKKEK